MTTIASNLESPKHHSEMMIGVRKRRSSREHDVCHYITEMVVILIEKKN